MFCFGNHVREKELCRLTQCGIGTRAKKLHIRFESVMVPHLQRDPDARRDKQSPAESSTGRRIPPCVRNCVANPSRGAVHLFRRSLACYAKTVDQGEERHLAFGEIRDFCSPVILLRIDVEMEVIGPAHAARQAVVPDTL